MKKMLTIHEVAEILNLTYMTVWQYVREGIIPSIKLKKLYRIKPEDLEKYIKNQTYKSKMKGD